MACTEEDLHIDQLWQTVVTADASPNFDDIETVVLDYYDAIPKITWGQIEYKLRESKLCTRIIADKDEPGIPDKKCYAKTYDIIMLRDLTKKMGCQKARNKARHSAFKPRLRRDGKDILSPSDIERLRLDERKDPRPSPTPVDDERQKTGEDLPSELRSASWNFPVSNVPDVPDDVPTSAEEGSRKKDRYSATRERSYRVQTALRQVISASSVLNRSFLAAFPATAKV
ncbi:hypothetical protein HKX48_005719 [Thoreauomyces humboldtii]|nr:hypothetical protein HKX48_005719 [Thoreauomyces humboldtii]